MHFVQWITGYRKHETNNFANTNYNFIKLIIILHIVWSTQSLDFQWKCVSWSKTSWIQLYFWYSNTFTNKNTWLLSIIKHYTALWDLITAPGLLTLIWPLSQGSLHTDLIISSLVGQISSSLICSPLMSQLPTFV